jgi:integrase
MQGFYNAAEMQRLFAVFKEHRLKLPVLVAAFYGMRRGEVLGLKWDAIDFEQGTITVKRTVISANIDGKVTVIEQDSAKTKSSLRTLTLVSQFRQCFMAAKETQEQDKKVFKKSYNYNHDGSVPISSGV